MRNIFFYVCVPALAWKILYTDEREKKAERVLAKWSYTHNTKTVTFRQAAEAHAAVFNKHFFEKCLPEIYCKYQKVKLIKKNGEAHKFKF